MHGNEIERVNKHALNSIFVIDMMINLAESLKNIKENEKANFIQDY